jgi:hypothetical protein
MSLQRKSSGKRCADEFGEEELLREYGPPPYPYSPLRYYDDGTQAPSHAQYETQHQAPSHAHYERHTQHQAPCHAQYGPPRYQHAQHKVPPLRAQQDYDSDDSPTSFNDNIGRADEETPPSSHKKARRDAAFRQQLLETQSQAKPF